jgi:hypothetical protein
MSKLALLGGVPVTTRLQRAGRFARRRDLELKYLLHAYRSGMWDDWPDNTRTMADAFRKEWAAFSKSKFCALLTNGTHTLQVALGLTYEAHIFLFSLVNLGYVLGTLALCEADHGSLQV